MKKLQVNFDLGMIVGIGIIITLIITATVARIVYGPNSPPEETIEELILKKYGIDIEFSPQDDKEYEIMIDKETEKRIIKEKKDEPNSEAIDVTTIFPDYYFELSSICSIETPTDSLVKEA